MMLSSRHFLGALLLLASLWKPSPGLGQAIPGSKQTFKYLNPIHEKSYLNQSQDRAIKKKSFKSAAFEGAQAIPNKEIGLFATIENEKVADTAYVDELLQKPEVNGVACLLTWKQLEPKEDVYNWPILDKVLESCVKHQKLLILKISTCGVDAPESSTPELKDSSDTPSWVFEQGAKSVPYTGRDGKQHLMPVFWDTTYLAKWANFINELGARYDKNLALHSVGITGGGIFGSTQVVPDVLGNKANYEGLEQILKKDFGMNPRQIVGHWKYVADLFPKAFPNTRLNFDIDPPTPNRSGQDCLDEISDYLVFRYGERVYLTRQNVVDGKHGFDQYRVFLKFRPDTLTGLQISPSVDRSDLEKITKWSSDDGVSFAEIPGQFFLSKDNDIASWLTAMRSRLGYQLVSQKVELPERVTAGEPLKASFTFLNLGAAPPMKPMRYLDKDRASSYKVQLELRDQSGKPVALSLHTPTIPTNRWIAGKPVSWEEELKMPKLGSGKYSVWVSVVDTDSKRKLNLLDATSSEPRLSCEIAAGNILIE